MPNLRTVVEIEEAVQKPAPAGLKIFREWFFNFDAAMWDEQIESDVKSGLLDSLADEALSDHREGRTKNLAC